MESFREALVGLHVEWEAGREVGDTLLLVIKQEGRGAASGVEVEQRFSWVMTFQGGRCIRWHIYADHNTALKAAGLSA
jgi:ketosteroid isomerase-like protein